MKKYLLLICFSLGLLLLRGIKLGYPEADQKSIVAEEVRIIDKNRRTRILMKTDSDGNPFIIMNDNKRQSRITLSLENSGAVIGLKDQNGKSRVGMKALNDNSTYLFLNDKNENLRMNFIISPQDDSNIFLCDKDMNPRLALSVTSENKPILGLLNGKGDIEWVMPEGSREGDTGYWKFIKALFK